MDYVTGMISRFTESILNMNIQQAIRLTIIVGAYILFRNIASKHLTKKQLESRVRQDEARIQKEKKDGLIEDPNKISGNNSSTSGFGWGKKTRKRVQRQEEMFERAVDELKRKQELGITEDSDDEIAELLED
ncbi:similar to Saccharomyces cerevisiae YNL149C PGA2 Essential protein required for maturation of Gas1p and Pho8p [Maudiozyma barnettii]|uniref:Similar to Saccharomyces cerevisiae YNL149C PGA2 Essential protein required for maturation of Gas1p and Pho8p n=1 Tax=Maudiozyma barnettii TaxID=61262 RepID=A0A8H2ZHN0_9SACH|nr:Pga2p [Kazachstania barnettii]CAB4252294.1 similar to Saccharomyces cerevisiae YNL149C PGA2 Essential protein required for maturation of Gas1p and Pho8p [Kazachstania barnettii]CAD1779007.1 similar to Saccharomyces cerevisiae YNL149C PGA2 Essential protein required for maturation of Gas1p and Pho8p [Kazachstania barnettii]